MTCARALRSLPVLVLAGASIAVPSAGSSSARAPLAAAASSTAAAVSAGGAHTCALTGAGGVKCWGTNSSGELGDGTTTERHIPVDVSGLTSGVVAVSAGAHTCALTSAGGVKCWGENHFGELGDGTETERRTPVNVSGLTSGAAAVAAGAHTTCALTSAGGVKCWGSNAYGQLGDGTITERHTPVNVSGLTSGAAAVSAGDSHTCALTSAGGVRCWGNNELGQLGDGTITDRHTPVNVSGLTSGVAAVAAGVHTCALTSGGGVKCWGYNNHGQLGDNKACASPCTTPVNVSGLTSGVAAISVGLFHTCALTSAGGVKCWGSNAIGNLGDGTITDRHTPVNVSGLTRGAAAVSAGGVHTCALTSAGGLRCWGYNSRGQLGDDKACGSRCSTPVQVVGFGRAQCAVPKVTGKKLAAAKRAIGKAHCSVGKVTKAYSKRVKKRRVISQKPKPGATLPAASPVALRVSKGPRK
jgi:alpha-tubulin suppressor-like RCC1 family protein